ncbi:unnamed protein product [Effrenium voratum]|nr:unnamed protein product [Effrenium voratum]
MQHGQLWQFLGFQPAAKQARVSLEHSGNWEETLRDWLLLRGHTLEDVQGRIFSCSGRPVDVLYLSELTPEHFPLQLDLPDLGAQPSQQLKLEFILDDIGGKEEEQSFLPLMSLSGLRKRRGSMRRSQSLQSLVTNVGHILRVYVQVTCNGRTQKTNVQEVEQGCSASFLEEDGLFFDNAELGGGKAMELSAVRIAVYDKRSSWIRGDALLGEEWLFLPPEVQSGKTLEQTLRLRHRGIILETKVRVRFTLLSLEDARATLAASAKHSLLRVTKALVQLLQVPGGVSLLLKACPEGIHNVTKEEIQKELRDLQGRLAEPWADSDEELCLEKMPGAQSEQFAQFMSGIARQLLDFVEHHTKPAAEADIPKLMVDWMLHLSAQVPVRNAMPASTREAFASEARLRRFLASAQLDLEVLAPSDADGNIDSDWKREATSLRESGKWHFALMNVPECAVLGCGSFGTVWRARDVHTGHSYAVKNVTVPRRGFAKVAQRESEVADRLSKEPHRCVVQLFHAKHFPDLRMYCFVMELCSKGNLTSHIRKLRSNDSSAGFGEYVAPAEAFHWIGQLLLGLEHLHVMNMLVRDLKTDNVVLSDQGRADRIMAKITDFGLCRFGTEATGDWTFDAPPGTPAYIAPEVIKGQNYGKAADLYSFGAVIWVILTGGLKVLTAGLPKVEPPCAEMAHKWDYSVLAQNCKLIAACVQNPEKHNARPLPSAAAKELVLGLTRDEAEKRPSLPSLRRHKALVHLKLPPAPASSKQADAWLATLCCLSCGGHGCSLCRLMEDGGILLEDSPLRTEASEDASPKAFQPTSPCDQELSRSPETSRGAEALLSEGESDMVSTDEDLPLPLESWDKVDPPVSKPAAASPRGLGEMGFSPRSDEDKPGTSAKRPVSQAGRRLHKMEARLQKVSAHRRARAAALFLELRPHGMRFFVLFFEPSR